MCYYLVLVPGKYQVQYRPSRVSSIVTLCGRQDILIIQTLQYLLRVQYCVLRVLIQYCTWYAGTVLVLQYPELLEYSIRGTGYYYSQYTYSSKVYEFTSCFSHIARRTSLVISANATIRSFEQISSRSKKIRIF